VAVAVAVSCWVCPAIKVTVAGVTAILVIALASTVSASEPVTPESTAEIFACPAATLVTSPPEETVATAVLEEDQVAVDVTFVVEPSL